MKRYFWKVVHNAVVHPLLSLPVEPQWVLRLHDWTAQNWNGLAAQLDMPSERQPVAWAVYFKRQGDLREDRLIVLERYRAEKEVEEKLITRIVPLYE